MIQRSACDKYTYTIVTIKVIRISYVGTYIFIYMWSVAPSIRTYFAGGSNETTVTEGDSVLLHCEITANPSPYLVRWIYSNKQVRSLAYKSFIMNMLIFSLIYMYILGQGLNQTVVEHLPTYSGDGVPDQTLALVNVSHLDMGFYFCRTASVLGDAESNSSIELIVNCKSYRLVHYLLYF